MNMFAWIRKKVRDLARPRDESPAKAARLNAVQYIARSNVTTINHDTPRSHDTEATLSMKKYYKEDGSEMDDNSSSSTIDSSSQDSYRTEEETVEIVPLRNGDVEAEKSTLGCQEMKSGDGQKFSNSSPYRKKFVISEGEADSIFIDENPYGGFTLYVYFRLPEELKVNGATKGNHVVNECALPCITQLIPTDEGMKANMQCELIDEHKIYVLEAHLTANLEGRSDYIDILEHWGYHVKANIIDWIEESNMIPTNQHQFSVAGSVKSRGKITRTRGKNNARTSAKTIQDTLEGAAQKLAAYDSQQEFEFIACSNCFKLVENEICISLDTCQHKVCPRCLRALVHDIIVHNAIEKMKCPVADCNMKIPRKYFMLFLEGEWRED